MMMCIRSMFMKTLGVSPPGVLRRTVIRQDQLRVADRIVKVAAGVKKLVFFCLIDPVRHR